MKRKMLKSLLATTLAATMLAGTLTGCGSSNSSSGGDSAAGTEAADAADRPDTWIADRTITIQAYVDDIGYSLPEDMNNTPVMQEITKRTGIKLDIQYTPGDSDSAVMASQLASGTIPDVIVNYLNDSTRKEFPLLLKAAKEGMFADLSSYIPDSKVYSRYLEEDFLPNDSYKNIVFREDFDGAVYIMHLGIDKVDRSLEWIPESEYLGGLYIQQAIVDKLGIDPTKINTQEQFYQLLVDIKNGGFVDDNGNPVYPLGPKFWGGSNDSMEYFLRGFDWGVSDGYNMDENGNIMHEVETDYVFDKINFVRKLLAEGLINPEFFTMDGTRAEEVSKTHNSGIIADVHNYSDIIADSDDWVPLGVLFDFTGDAAKATPGKTGYGSWAVSADAENPEEIFAFFDYLSTTEGQLLCQYGVEGLHYNMVDGYPVLTDEVLEKLNAGDTDWLINEAGAGFGGSGVVFFDYIITNKDYAEDFGESRPGAGANTNFARSIQIATDYPRTKKLVPGLKATAYLSADSMTEVNAQMALLDYKEMLVQAMYATSDAEVQAIVEGFRTQMKQAGLDEFKAYLKELYDADPESITFYN